MKHNEWYPWLQNEFQQPYFKPLAAFVHEAYENGPVYPPKVQVFSAFETADLPDIRVVILGQDPYHQRGQAHGMCFLERRIPEVGLRFCKCTRSHNVLWRG